MTINRYYLSIHQTFIIPYTAYIGKMVFQGTYKNLGLSYKARRCTRKLNILHESDHFMHLLRSFVVTHWYLSTQKVNSNYFYTLQKEQKRPSENLFIYHLLMIILDVSPSKNSHRTLIKNKNIIFYERNPSKKQPNICSQKQSSKYRHHRRCFGNVFLLFPVGLFGEAPHYLLKQSPQNTVLRMFGSTQVGAGKQIFRLGCIQLTMGTYSCRLQLKQLYGLLISVSVKQNQQFPNGKYRYLKCSDLPMEIIKLQLTVQLLIQYGIRLAYHAMTPLMSLKFIVELMIGSVWLYIISLGLYFRQITMINGYGAPNGQVGVMSQQQMMMIPGMVMPFYSNGVINYSGPVAGFVLQFNNMSAEEKMAAKVLHVVLMGNIVQETGTCCLVLTIMAGSICIFPLCLLCCDCFIKAIAELRDLPADGYVAVDNVISQCPNLQKVMVTVLDSLLDQNKTSILERNLQRLPRLISLDFTNISPALNVKGREYDDFDQYFPITKASKRILYNLAWGKKAIRFTNPPVQLSQSFHNPELSKMNFGNPYPAQNFNMGNPY